jgi:hypothetical protein
VGVDVTNPREFIDKVLDSFACDQIQAMKYFATRFYNFLHSLTEIKSMPHDEKSLHQFDKYVL